VNSFALAVVLLCAPAAGTGSIGARTTASTPAADAVAAEWLVRDRAARLDESIGALATDLRSEEWRVRRAAVEVLARTRGGPDASALILTALRDEHPNVRARAVDAAGTRRVDAGPALWDLLERDALPATRRALVRSLSLVRPADVAARLARLAQDEDPQVGEEAFLALLALGDDGAAESAAEWRRRGLAEDGTALLEATEALARGPRAQQLFLSLEADASPAELALLVAAEARVGGTPDPRALLAGWFETFPSDDTIIVLRRRAQQYAGAEALGAAVLPHLIRDLQAFDRWFAGNQDDLAGRRPRLAERFRAKSVSAQVCRDEWTEAALGAARGSGAALGDLMRSLSDSGFDAFAALAYGRLDALEAPRAWGPPGSDPVRSAGARFAMTELAGEIYVRTQDAGAAAWLVRALSDPYQPCRREAAFALSSVADLRRYEHALYAAWKHMDQGVTVDWLTRFSRLHELPSFRDDLMRLWEEDVREVSVIELLGAFEGDQAVIERVTLWMRRELRRLELEAAGEDALRPASEGLAKACVSALVRLGAEEAVFLEALQRAEPISEEIAKTAAAQLGKSARGREMLLPWLAPARPQRLRIEAALAIAQDGNDAAIEVLVAGYANCDEELQVRALRALGASGSEAGWTLPARVAADRWSGAGARLVAFEVLGDARPTERAVRALLELAAPDRDLEGRRLALRALGSTASAEAQEDLAALAQDGFEHESLREEWLVASARCATSGPTDRWFEAWGARPRQRGAEQLRARFRGERTAAAEFTYRAELEAARVLAGFADEMLAANEGWWRGDARWLHELGEVWRDAAPDSERAAVRVVRAATIALSGEGSADDRALLRAKLGLRLVEAARASGDFVEAERTVAELLIDWRLGRVRQRDFERALGTVDPVEGRDPRARLEVLGHDSRARAALARGDHAAARSWLARAEAACGASAAARRDCAQLARDLR
jgi:HEAT repeat protein